MMSHTQICMYAHKDYVYRSTYVYVYVYACIYVYVFVFVYLFINLFRYIRIYIYVTSMHTCMHGMCIYMLMSVGF